MEDQNTVNYREALRALWDLEASPPEDGDTEWVKRWDTQVAAIERTTKQVIKVRDLVGVLRIITDERKTWKKAQEPKAEA